MKKKISRYKKKNYKKKTHCVICAHAITKE